MDLHFDQKNVSPQEKKNLWLMQIEMGLIQWNI